MEVNWQLQPVVACSYMKRREVRRAGRKVGPDVMEETVLDLIANFAVHPCPRHFADWAVIHVAPMIDFCFESNWFETHPMSVLSPLKNSWILTAISNRDITSYPVDAGQS